ncbi:MAG: zinc finger domain-containing protein [Burkholderiaceae bacterium]
MAQRTAAGARSLATCSRPPVIWALCPRCWGTSQTIGMSPRGTSTPTPKFSARFLLLSSKIAASRR